ncbi:MAG: LamG domain-containing protein [Candidatus Hodarchaeales archaeon]
MPRVSINARVLGWLLVIQALLSGLQLFLPTWIAVVNSFVIVYLISGIFLLSLFITKDMTLVKLLSLSIIISSIAIPVFTLVMGYFFYPVQYLYFIFGILMCSLAVILIQLKIKRDPIIITLNGTSLAWFILILASILVVSRFLSLLPAHIVTPDETFQINAAYIFLDQGKIFPIGYDIIAMMPSYLLTSRAFSTVQLASFIASLPTWSITIVNLNSLFFLFGLSIVSSHLMYEVNMKRNNLFGIIPLLIISNPMLLMLSSYGLTDLSFAFYSCVFSLFFVRSLITKDGVFPNYSEMLCVLSTAFIMIMIKPNFVLLITAIVMYLYFAFKFGWYKVKIGKALLILIFIPILLFLLIDLYRFILIFLLGIDQTDVIVRSTYSLFPFSIINNLLNLKEGISSISPLNQFWILNVIISPQNLSIIGLSCFILSILYSFVSKDYDDKIKKLAILIIGAIFISYIGTIHIGYNSWIVSRYYAFLIPLIIVLALSYIQQASHYASIIQITSISTLIVLVIMILTQSYRSLPYSYLVISDKVGIFSIPLFHMLLVCVFLFLIQFIQHLRTLSLKVNLYKITITTRVMKNHLVPIVYILTIIISNLYFSSSAFDFSSAFKYQELDELSTSILAGDFVISNYYGISSYMKDEYSSVVWIMPPTKEEFYNVISHVPDGSKLFVSRGGFSSRTEKYVGSYFTEKDFYSSNFFNAKSWKEQATDVTSSENILFFLHMFEGQENITITGLETHPIFKNISWVNYEYLKIPRFEKSESYIEIPYSEKFNISSPFTVEAWVKPEDISSSPVDRCIADISLRSGGGFYLFLRKGVPWFTTAFGEDAVSGLNVQEGMWNHIVVSYNGTYTTFFVNTQKKVVEGPKFKEVPEGHSLFIGKSHWGSDRYFKGNIGWLALFNGQMKDDDVLERYGWASGLLFQESIGNVCEVYEVESGKVGGRPTEAPNISYSWSIDTMNISSIDEAYVVLNLNLKSEKEDFLTVIISTECFSQLHTFQVFPGDNHIDLRFKNSQNGLQYGALIARMSRIIVLDGEGQILLDDMTGIHMFSFLDFLFYCSFIGMVIFLLLMSLKTREF